ncbi:MAG: hypothetical protein QW057_09190 [Candidatus Bathyarchaeia archaeon]
MPSEVLAHLVKELDEAYPDIIEVRKAFFLYRDRHPELNEEIRAKFAEWLDRKFSPVKW